MSKTEGEEWVNGVDGWKESNRKGGIYREYIKTDQKECKRERFDLFSNHE